jgi:GT2 family glycosyltransferase
MKSVIYTLYQRTEFHKMRGFIAQVLPDLGAALELVIIINDTDCVDLRAHVADMKHVYVFCENANLGVAGGRNYMIDKATALGAEFLISCDTDIIVELGYFTSLRDAYMDLRKTDPDVGFVQPMLLNGPDVKDCFAQLEGADWNALADSLAQGGEWRHNFWARTVDSLGVDKALAAIFHTGVSNLWLAHFDAPLDPKGFIPGSSEAFRDTFKTLYPTLRSEPEVLLKLIALGRPVRIMSPAGGVTAFHTDAMTRSGGYSDLFNPFAFEDSELGFRSTMAGLNNYLMPQFCAIHDTLVGDNNRAPMYQARIGVLRGAEIAGSKLSEEETDYAITQRRLIPFVPAELHVEATELLIVA